MQLMKMPNGDIVLFRTTAASKVEMTRIPDGFLMWGPADEGFYPQDEKVNKMLDPTWRNLPNALLNLVPTPDGFIGDENANHVGTWRIEAGKIKLMVEMPIKNNHLEVVRS